MANLRRAASLSRSFKRTAIDQSADDERTFVVGDLIDDVLRSLQHQLKRVPVTVAVDCPRGLEIHGVPGLLEQLLTNLVMNSVTHGFGEGQRPGRITIRVALDNGRLRFDYADNGVGMTAEVLGRVFEPFFTTRREQGARAWACMSVTLL